MTLTSRGAKSSTDKGSARRTKSIKRRVTLKGELQAVRLLLSNHRFRPVHRFSALDDTFTNILCNVFKHVQVNN